MGCSLVRVPLGGMRDEAAIRGHRRTYVVYCTVRGLMKGRVPDLRASSARRGPVADPGLHCGELVARSHAATLDSLSGGKRFAAGAVGERFSPLQG